jgi:hypothetical protein
VDFIVVHGVDAYGIINTVHDILGLPPYGSKYHTRRGVGINGLLQDVIANLPLDELKALFDEKKGTSPDFQDLLIAIQSDEFAVSIHCVLCQLLLMLCAYFCVNSYDECITHSAGDCEHSTCLARIQ